MNKIKSLLLGMLLCVFSTAAFATDYNLCDYSTLGEGGQVTVDCSVANFLYDSGGTSNYSANESFTYFICTGNAGAISLTFTQFNLASGTLMSIFDGQTDAVLYTNASGTALLNQTIRSNHSCIKIVWTSGQTTAAGFKATVTCGDACTPFSTNLTVTGATLSNGFYNVCPNTTINFVASNAASGGSGYVPTNVTYYWTVMDGAGDVIQGPGNGSASNTLSYTFTNSTGYYVMCEAKDANGCYNTNVNKIKVQVSVPPTFSGTDGAVSFHPNNICPGTEVTFNGFATSEPWRAIRPPIVAGTTFLPDGNSLCYNTSLTFDFFDPGATVTRATDIDNIYLNMEHSYMGDLSILIECPTGLQCLLKGYSGGSTMVPGWTLTGGIQNSNSSGGSNIHLGLAPDPSTGTDCYLTPGTGYSYYFVPNGTAAFGTGGPTSTPGYIDPCGGTESNSAEVLNSGEYAPYESMNALIGCPLNGTWTIYVCDHLNLDNGYIFEWGLYFRDDLYPDDTWQYQNQHPATGFAWSGENIQSGASGTQTATARPQTSGNINYTFTTTDDFGCAYDTVVTVHVLSATSSECCQQPTPSISAQTQVCGQNVDLNATPFAMPGNTGQWTFTGPGNVVLSNAQSPTTTATVGTYGTYTFTWTECYQGNAGCSGTTSVNITFYEVLDMQLTPIQSVCKSASQIQIEAPNFGTLTCSPNTNAFNATTRTFTPTSANPGTYTITNTSTATQCISNNPSTVTFSIYDEYTVTDVTETCGDPNSDGIKPVTLSFTVHGSTTPLSYNVNGSIFSRSGEAEESEASIAATNQSNANYSYTGLNALRYNLVVTDSHGCTTLPVAGLKDCGCLNYSGTINSGSSIMCTGQTYTIAHSGDVEETGAQLWWVIYTDPLNFSNNAIYVPSATTTISPQTISGNGGTFNFGTTYYLAAIVAYTTTGGMPNLNRCYSLSQPVSLIWKETPTPQAWANDTCGLVMRLNGSAITAAQAANGMTGYWTSTADYTTILGTTNNQNNPYVMLTGNTYGPVTFTWNVVNAECSASANATYTFNRIPSPFAGRDTTVCGMSYQMFGAHRTDGLETSGISWSGQGANINPPNIVTPIITANMPGTYTFVMTEDNNGCTASGDVRVTFLAEPSPTTTENVDTVCGYEARLEIINASSQNTGFWVAYNEDGTQLGNAVFYSQQGGSTVVDATLPVCTVRVPIPEDQTEIKYRFVWSETSNNPSLSVPCVGEAEKYVVFRKVPIGSAHVCGSTGNEVEICGNEVEVCGNMDASSSYASARWLIKEITDYEFDDPTSPNTTLTVNPEIFSGLSSLRIPVLFTLSNYSCSSADTLWVTFFNQPQANAGLDDAICGRDYTLNGAWGIHPTETYEPRGEWTVIGKPNASAIVTFNQQPADNIAESITVTDFGVYTFTFEEMNTAYPSGQCISVDTVLIEFIEIPTAHAGEDQVICGLETDMTAISSASPVYNTIGTWLAPDGGSDAFADSHDPTTHVTYSAYGTYNFVWMETNTATLTSRTCNTFDTVSIAFFEIPTASINVAHPVDSVCGLTYQTLRAEAPGVNINGRWWSSNLGSISYADANNNISNVTVPYYGNYDFYWIEYTGPEYDQYKCVDTSDAINVTFIEIPNTFAGIDTMFCGDNGYLNAIPSVGSGRWSTPNSGIVTFEDPSDPRTLVSSTIYNNTNAAINSSYQLIWMETAGYTCTNKDTVYVQFIKAPGSNISVVPPKCFGEDAVIYAIEDSLPYYDWSFYDGIVDSTHYNAQGGAYQQFVHWNNLEDQHSVGLMTRNSWGCQSAIGSNVIDEPAQPTYTYKIVQDTCGLGKGGVEFTDTLGYFSFFWMDTTVGPTITDPTYGAPVINVYNIPAGWYTLRTSYQSFNRTYYSQYYNYFGSVDCIDHPEIEIGTIGMIDAEIVVSADVVLEDLVAPEATVIFVNSTNYDNVSKRCEWHFGDGTKETNCDELVTHVYTEPGCFEPYLVVMNKNLQECRDTAYLDECIKVDKESFLDVPNIFSPNGDGINDYFQVKAETLKEFHGIILNRWGRKVFEWTDWQEETSGWDGMIGSSKAAPGVYFAIIDATGYDETPYHFEVSLHLVRE